MPAVHFSSSSVVTIGFDATNCTFTETITTVSRPVSLSVQSGFLDRDVVVTVQTMDGTATGGTACYTQTLQLDVLFMFIIFSPAPSDYTSVTMDLTFNADNTTRAVMIPIIGDNVVENTKSFTVSLTTVDSAVTLGQSTTTVNILDDDGA